MFSKRNCLPGFYIGPSQKLDFCWLKNYAPGATISWKGWVENWSGGRVFKQILSRGFCHVLLWRGATDSQLQKFWPSECLRLGPAILLSRWGLGAEEVLGAIWVAVCQGQENVFPAELRCSMLRSAAWPACANALQLIVKTPAISKIVVSRCLLRLTWLVLTGPD